jgi:hypothetical protein
MSDENRRVRMLGRLSGIALLVLIYGISLSARSACAQALPTDAETYCAVPQATFNGWFHSGSPALNGMVMPANSVAFSNPANNNCPFYQWAEQMFLWVTSQIPTAPGSGYGGFVPAEGTPPNIFDSTAFFDVSPPAGASGSRTLVPHPTEVIFVREAFPRSRKPGPNGLPLVKAKGGGMVEVEPLQPGPTGKALINDAAGKRVEIARVQIGNKGKATLFDAGGKAIALSAKSNPSPRVGHFVRAIAIGSICRLGAVCTGGGTGGTLVDVTTGSVIEVETGQATDNGVDFPVVMTRDNSLLYYSIMVNDVDAYFLAGSYGGGISPKPTHFPTSEADLNQITAFAAMHGASFPDSDALIVELKASWIDASTLPAGAAASYITTQATIPTYTSSANGTAWTQGPNKQATLALVGMHLVGSASGHPEMIFATFEHLGNAPDAAYSYISTTPRPPIRGDETVTVAQNTSGNWQLAKSGSTGPFNVPHMDILNGVVGSIQAQASFTVSPSDTIRLKAWGAASDTTPNPNVSSPAVSNTQIISLNNSVHAMMSTAGAGADVRNNYILIGATWTLGGAPPGISFGVNPNQFGATYPVNVVGTSQLFNSTMETYDQGSNTTLLGGLSNGQGLGDSCFDCHGSNNKGTLFLNGLSHIYQYITAGSVPK